MAIKTYKPTTPSRRHMTVSAFEGIDKKAKPERSLTENLKKNAATLFPEFGISYRKDFIKDQDIR